MAQAQIGNTQCADSNLNLGFGRCTWEPGLIHGGFLIPKGTYGVNTDYADPATYINGKLHNDSAILQWHKLPMFVGLEPSNTEAGKETYAYGPMERAGTDFVSWKFKFRQGKMCAYLGLASFEGLHEKYDILFMDKSGKLLGTKKIVAGVTRIYGFALSDIYIPMWEPQNQSTNVSYQVEFSFENTAQLKNNLVGLDSGLDYTDLIGIQDINIEFYSSAAAGVFQFILRDACGGNLGETYGTELASAPLWDFYNATTGAQITTTSVAYSAITKRFTVNLDEADGDYSTTANNIKGQLDLPSVLSAAFVEWYRSIPIYVTGIA